MKRRYLVRGKVQIEFTIWVQGDMEQGLAVPTAHLLKEGLVGTHYIGFPEGGLEILDIDCVSLSHWKPEVWPTISNPYAVSSKKHS